MKCLSLHVTDMCNSSCRFCVVGAPLHQYNSCSEKEIFTFLESNSKTGFGVVNLHGGEPTIHPRFEALLEHIGRLGYPQIHLQTNGIRLAEQQFVKALKGYRVTRFIVSIHGDSAKSHEFHTCKTGGFAKTIQAVKHIKASGGHVRTNTVVTTRNLFRLPDIAAFVCDLGVDHVNISNMHPVGSARFSAAWLMPKLESVRPHLFAAVDAIKARGVKVTLEGFPICLLGQRYSPFNLNCEYRYIKLFIRGQILEDYDNFMRSKMRVTGKACRECSDSPVCGGVYPEYIDYYGWDEFAPSGQRVKKVVPV